MTCLDVANSTCDGSFAVTDPELVLGALDEQGSRARANAANGQAIYGSLFLLSAVTDVATVAAGKADATTGVATAALAEEGAAVAANGRETLSSIGSERQLWTNVALRKNTLLPGHGAAGLVFIPVDLRARYLWMHVRAGGQVFAFGFKQIVRRVDANGMSHRS
jgi:hypothetical protein